MLDVILVSKDLVQVALDQCSGADGSILSDDVRGENTQIFEALLAHKEEVEQVFFSVKGQKIKVNDAEIQVFEYSDEASRKADSDQISPDGTNIGTSMITWVDQPNFWAKGRVIVLYIGKEAATIDLLTGVMGKPITTHG